MKCASTHEDRKPANWSDPAGILSSILVVLLPKCSLCLFAYTGAIAMCSGKSLILPVQPWGISVFILLSLFILFGLQMNHRGKRTYRAFAAVGIGIVLIALSIALPLDQNWYYVGSGFLFLGIWINGSLYYILRKVKELMNHNLKYL